MHKKSDTIKIKHHIRYFIYFSLFTTNLKYIFYIKHESFAKMLLCFILWILSSQTLLFIIFLWIKKYNLCEWGKFFILVCMNSIFQQLLSNNDNHKFIFNIYCDGLHQLKRESDYWFLHCMEINDNQQLPGAGLKIRCYGPIFICYLQWDYNLL